jgi:DNA-binding beta-propeller fold protein YncE/tRNA A-37 threonylcarbamoyl transferase component Bud32
MPDTGPAGGGPAVGAVFAGHRIEAVIGEGGMGIVYRARNLALDRIRALKVLAPSLSADDRFRDRFRRESRLAASIEHPNVIPVHQAGEEDGHLYLAMRLVEGRDLRDMVAVEGPLDPAQAAAVIGPIAAGLDAAHAAGLIHRDVKPANVLVGSGADAGRVYLTDFGISRTTRGGETVTSTGELVGTADFVAPEQIAGGAVDHRADLYALGAVLYFTLTGESPFPRENQLATLFAHANAPRPRPSEARETLSSRLDPLVAKAMAVDPEQRFASAAALARALDAVVEGEETVPLSPPPVTRPSERADAESSPARSPGAGSRRRRAGPWLVVAAMIAGVAIAAILLTGGGDGDGGAAQPSVGGPVEVGGGPVAVTVGPDRVWVAARAGGEIDAIDKATSEVAFEIPVPNPTSVAVGFGSVWAISKVTDTLYRLDPVEGTAPVEIPLGEGADPSDVAVDNDWVWVANAGAQNVVRIDPDGNAPAGNVPLGTEPRAIATGDGLVWVTNIRSASVSRIDPDGPERTGSSIPVGELPNDIAVGEGSAWVTSSLNGTVYEIDPQSGDVIGEPIAVGDLPRGIRAGLGYVWVALGGGSSVVRIDPQTGALVGTPIHVGEDPADLALGTETVWTANEADSTVSRIAP